MGNWIPDMWQRKVAHFAEVPHPVPKTILGVERHITDHHPELNALSPEIAAHGDLSSNPELIRKMIDIHLNSHHPGGAKAGDHPHTHGDDLDVAIPDTIETIAPTYIQALASRKKYANEICGCGNPATGYDKNGHPCCSEHTGSLMDYFIRPLEGEEGERAAREHDNLRDNLRDNWHARMKTRQEIDMIPSFTDEEWKAKGVTFNGIPHAGSRINWQQRYATAEVYRHPITGNGICGAPGGCAECGTHLGAIQGIMGGELFPEGRSAEDHSSAIGGAIDSLSKANGHWMSNPHELMPKSPTQHLAGMVDKLKGFLEGVRVLKPGELTAGTKQDEQDAFANIHPLKGYAGGKTADETNFEEDGELPHI